MANTMESGLAGNADALATRLFSAVLEAMDLMTVYIGDRLGYYRALAELGSATASELAGRAGTVERYAREWLEQQATTGIIDVDDPEAAADQRRFSLPDGHDEDFGSLGCASLSDLGSLGCASLSDFGSLGCASL